jgi:tRNA modification GTPase
VSYEIHHHSSFIFHPSVMPLPPTTADSNANCVVELTPPGRAAVAVVLVAGPEATRIVRDCFCPASARWIDELPLQRIVLGRWGAAQGEELVACRRAEHEIEIHCHGGAAAVRTIVDQLAQRGCVTISWQDWLLRSSRNALPAAAQIALAQAPTLRTAAVLLDQFHGALSRAIDGMLAAIAAGDWGRAIESMEDVLRYRDVGKHLTTPWRVVIAGPPNVGKSSLLNTLAGYQRAIVSPLPGTTRDVVTLLTAIDGWPVELVDTAGLRASGDELESAGVALAGAVIKDADAVLLVSDASQEIKPDSEFVHRARASSRVVHVCNKIDLLPPPVRARQHSAPANLQLVSALTGEGIAELVVTIGALLVPQPPPAGAAVPFTAAHIACLDETLAALQRRDAASAVAALNALLGAPEKNDER